MNLNIDLKSAGSSLSRFGYGTRLHPQRDWLALLALAAVALVASVGWNLWLFSRATDSRPLGEGVTLEQPKPFDIGPTRALFERRAAERARYVDDYRFADPSR